MHFQVTPHQQTCISPRNLGTSLGFISKTTLYGDLVILRQYEVLTASKQEE